MSVPTTRADGRAQDPKPAQRSAADVQGAPARSAAAPREELAPGGLPQLGLQLRTPQLRRSLREQVALARPVPRRDRRIDAVRNDRDLFGGDPVEVEQVLPRSLRDGDDADVRLSPRLAEASATDARAVVVVRSEWWRRRRS